MKVSNENVHKNHRERMKEKFLKYGLEGFSDVEKLEFILFYSIAQKNTNVIAHNLLNRFGTFDRVLEASVKDLSMVDGVGMHSAILLHLMLETISAYGRSKCEEFIKGTKDAKKFAQNLFIGKCVEEFYVICLSSSNKVLETCFMNRGTASEVNVEINQITAACFRNKCSRILITHNHPQGKCNPSDEDVSFTSKILMSCILNEIEVLDHIIVSNESAISLEETGLLRQLKFEAVRKVPTSPYEKNKFGQSSNNYLIG